jgi:diaminopimelate decarboxylase
VSRLRNVTPKFSDQELFQLAEKFGTPYFLIDESVLRRAVSELERAYQKFKGPFRVAYSIKANYNPSVIRTFISEGIMFDLTASNELQFLIKCGGSPQNVIYTSITETTAEYEEVVKHGVRKIVVSSFNGLVNLIEARAKVGGDVEVLIRVNPEVSVQAELRFSIKHGKFGVPLDSANEDSAISLLRKILSTPGLNFEGFHFHLGSQIEDPSCYAVAMEKLESFILGARRELGDFPVRTIDIGGGLPAPYGRVVPSPDEFSSQVLERLNSVVESLGAKFTLIVESGRFLSAESTIMVARVVNVKKFDEKRYLEQVKARRGGARQAGRVQGRRRLLLRDRLAVPLPAKAVHPDADDAGAAHRGQEGADPGPALRRRRRRHAEPQALGLRATIVNLGSAVPIRPRALLSARPFP